MQAALVRSSMYKNYLLPYFTLQSLVQPTAEVRSVWGGSIVTQLALTEAICRPCLVTAAILVLIYAKLALVAAANYICSRHTTH